MIPDDLFTRTLLAVLLVALFFLAVVVALVVLPGRTRRRDAAAFVDITPASLDRLIEQLDALDTGLRHYPCRPDQVCDLHDPGVCAVTRCCPACKTNSVRRGA